MFPKLLLCFLLKFFKIRLKNKNGLASMKLIGILSNISTNLAKKFEQKE